MDNGFKLKSQLGWETIKGYKIKMGDGTWSSIYRSTLKMLPKSLEIDWDDQDYHYFMVDSVPEGHEFWKEGTLSSNLGHIIEKVDPLVETGYPNFMKIKFTENNNSTLLVNDTIITATGLNEIIGFMCASVIKKNKRPATIVDATYNSLPVFDLELEWYDITEKTFNVICTPVQDDWNVLLIDSVIDGLIITKSNESVLTMKPNSVNDTNNDKDYVITLADNRPGELTNKKTINIKQFEKPELIISPVSYSVNFDDKNTRIYNVNLTPDRNDWELKSLDTNLLFNRISDTKFSLTPKNTNADINSLRDLNCTVGVITDGPLINKSVKITQFKKPTLSLAFRNITFEWDVNSSTESKSINVSTNIGDWTIDSFSNELSVTKINNSLKLYTLLENKTNNDIIYNVTIRHNIDTTLTDTVTITHKKPIINMTLSSSNSYVWNDITEHQLTVNTGAGGWNMSFPSGIVATRGTSGTSSTGTFYYKFLNDNTTYNNKTYTITASSLINPSKTASVSITHNKITITPSISGASVFEWNDMNVHTLDVSVVNGSWEVSYPSEITPISGVNGISHGTFTYRIKNTNTSISNKSYIITVKSLIDPSKTASITLTHKYEPKYISSFNPSTLFFPNDDMNMSKIVQVHTIPALEPFTLTTTSSDFNLHNNNDGTFGVSPTSPATSVDKTATIKVALTSNPLISKNYFVTQEKYDNSIYEYQERSLHHFDKNNTDIDFYIASAEDFTIEEDPQDDLTLSVSGTVNKVGGLYKSIVTVRAQILDISSFLSSAGGIAVSKTDPTNTLHFSAFVDTDPNPGPQDDL